MSQTNPGAIATSSSEIVRAAVVAADSATLDDTNFDPDDATACAGWEKVNVHVTFVGGTDPTATVVPLRRAGSAWLPGTATAALAAGTLAEVDVMGRLTYFRISAITGTPDSVTVRCLGWKPFKYDGPSR